MYYRGRFFIPAVLLPNEVEDTQRMNLKKKKKGIGVDSKRQLFSTNLII